MRSFVIALMIALLPLRGWVGDAMAEQMALPSLQVAAHTGVTHAHCALHDASAGAVQAQDSAADAAHEACSACQACHSFALEASVGTITLPTLDRILTPVASLSFASAERALGVKPPIV